MQPEFKKYVVKEYGLWSVLLVSALVGLAVSKVFMGETIPLLFALGLLANAKQAYTSWAANHEDKRSFGVFGVQIVLAIGIFVVLFGQEVLALLPLLIFPAAYLLLRRLFGERFLLTELLGIMILSLAAVIVKFQLVGEVDARLFGAVACYFMASSFKVKALLSKSIADRVWSVLYLGFALFAYWGMQIPLIILLPLLDNLLAAVAPYQVKLKTTGWIEVAKSLLFLGLMAALY